ncbi:(R,R)-butanediol dehydrogenase/meso-butanediol dehydrogenase/diacetyl reductase [Pseudoclavibacter sp. JAI123]|uniref:zinc-dependent alcohol dehydrogenase n=1 Tax=Pseudoclavibacter sp. JAI123 TaxID=2723065 RepID=UPI0015C69F61|nr:zinc-binding dehydrogenase [Pseudoclavibacter sp. JAI123]NYF14217.1 (R,R)-butanediol dehydrogenase/meso-butanediol dehydrogenase/diacetyl reductase [Pseudoclavibacter sp. JAI123]
MTQTRIASVTAPSTVLLRDEELASPGPGQVLVRIRYCGVCATDTHGYSAPQFIPKTVFGHEWSGTVVEVGKDVSTVEVGDRVVASVGPACGDCSMCRAGHAEQCDTAFAEANGVDPDAPEHGGFAQHLLVPERRVQRALDALSDEQLGVVEPTAVTFHAVRRARQELGAVVVVQGAGPIGLLTAQHARHAGAGVVIVVEPSESRRETARALGFTEVFEPGDEFRARVLETTDGRGADVLYECTGAAGLFQASAQLVRRGGALALLGYPMTDSQVSYGDWQSRELTVIGSLAYTHSDFVGAMRALAGGAVDAGPLITGIITLDELPQLLADLAEGSTQHAKVLVAPNG